MYIFRRSVTGRRVSTFCILLAQGEIHAQGENFPPPPPPPPPPTRMGLSALLDGNLGCWIVYFPLILHSLWGVS